MLFSKKRTKEPIGTVEELTLRLSGMRLTERYAAAGRGAQAEVTLRREWFGERGPEWRLEGRALCPAGAVTELLNACELPAWDGFVGEHPKYVCDGTMFLLEASVNGGRRIRAEGSENFPDHYGDLLRGLAGLLEGDGAQAPMTELAGDPFYAEIARHPACCVDYCLMKCGGPYRGEDSHRQAIRFAMEVFSRDPEEDAPLWTFDADKAFARPAAAAEFFDLPDEGWKTTRREKDGTTVTFYDAPTDGGEIPYWRAFLAPPHGTADGPEELLAVSRALFPNGPEGLTAYRWSTDWSDYFDDGHEWWGAGCWSVYDETLDRYAVIMASATD